MLLGNLKVAGLEVYVYQVYLKLLILPAHELFALKGLLAFPHVCSTLSSEGGQEKLELTTYL